MLFCVNDILYAFSYALDCVEHDLIGVSTHHGLRVACLSVILGKEIGLDERYLLDLAACAILHDNALTEYIRAEKTKNTDAFSTPAQLDLAPHCTIGERNLKVFPFESDMKGAILYHHENADGSGVFGKTEEETPLAAQLIHMGDQLDANWNLGDLTEERFEKLFQFVREQEGRLFSRTCVNAFWGTSSQKLLRRFKKEEPAQIIKQLLPRKLHFFNKEESIGFSNIFSAIIDYKSSFTGLHSRGVAALSAAMGRYYGYSEEDILKLYFAGAVHDIGKLVIDRDILEKPAKLTSLEFIQMKNHAYYSYKILSQIEGFEDITGWASFHHEKLDGSGYPFGKRGEELNKTERLMACIDIYQALTEKRPYKDGFSHEKAIMILRKMAAEKLIDESITEDLNTAVKSDALKHMLCANPL